MGRKQARFESLVQTHATELYRAAYWLCSDRHQAEDLVQETCARAWKSLDGLREQGAARAWLHTILRRENARRHERLEPELHSLDSVQLPAAASEFDSRPEAFALRQSLAQLPEGYRQPLIMQVLGGFSCEEIGHMLGLSANTVMTRVFRARKRLRGLLDDEPVVERDTGS